MWCVFVVERPCSTFGASRVCNYPRSSSVTVRACADEGLNRYACYVQRAAGDFIWESSSKCISLFSSIGVFVHITCETPPIQASEDNPPGHIPVSAIPIQFAPPQCTARPQ